MKTTQVFPITSNQEISYDIILMEFYNETSLIIVVNIPQ